MAGLEHVIDACRSLETRLSAQPGLIGTEADAQAELHALLLELLPGSIPIEPANELLTYPHHTWPLGARRAYREISAGQSRSTTRSDIVLLRNEPQILAAKSGGAPARFGRPAACLIEIKIDVGCGANARIARSVERDFSKWAEHIEREEADDAVTVVFTDRPDVYRSLSNPRIIAVKVEAARQHIPVSDAEARDALYEALSGAVSLHRSQPLSMLREKDFETQILWTLRRDKRIPASNSMTQLRLSCPRTGQLKPLDITVFGSDPFKARSSP